MGCLYRPMLKGKAPDFEPTPEDLALSRGVSGNGQQPDEEDARCHHPSHGRADLCLGCGARFGKICWAKYYVNGKPVRESTQTEKETEAKRFLKDREGSAVKGQPILPRVERIRYEEAAEDLRTHCKTTGERDLVEAETRLAHLDASFQSRRISAIEGAEISRYIAARQGEGAANGTINWELGLFSRLLRLAYKNKKLLCLPIIERLKEAKPRAGFFERGQFEAVKRHLRSDLQVAVPIAYAFGWRMQSEVLTLKREQVDLGACTIRLEPGTTKNDDGRLVYLTPQFVELL